MDSLRARQSIANQLALTLLKNNDNNKSTLIGFTPNPTNLSDSGATESNAANLLLFTTPSLVEEAMMDRTGERM